MSVKARIYGIFLQNSVTFDKKFFGRKICRFPNISQQKDLAVEKLCGNNIKTAVCL